MKIIAFIEIPDLVVRPGPNNGPAFIATNAAVRYGIIGQAINASSDQAFVDSLGTMRVVATDNKGKRLVDTEGSVLMGHPYNAVLYLKDDLRRRGITLKVGDMISLGAYSSPSPIADTRQMTTVYSGIGGRDISVTVNFR